MIWIIGPGAAVRPRKGAVERGLAFRYVIMLHIACTGAPIALNNTGFPDMKTTAGLALALLLALAPVPGGGLHVWKACIIKRNWGAPCRQYVTL